jgi:hypothetical protein
MDTLREFAPLLLGILISPVLGWIYRNTSETTRFAGYFFPSLILGAFTSFFAGELVNLTDGSIAIMIDTALIFTGTTVAYYALWSPLLGALHARQTAHHL